MSTLFESNRPYIKPEQEKNVFLHKYSGNIASFYYNYFQSPMCDWFVSFLPWTLAPNVITILGVLCVVSAVALQFLWYGTDANGYVDPWFMVLAGWLYFMNTVLDNMDGKQARRTGSGSPMGMLFDHGSDAFTAIMSSILLGRYF